MPIRDIIVVIFVFSSAVAGFMRPWIGVLALAVIAYLNPHQYAWSFAQVMPVYLIVFCSTVIGAVIQRSDYQPFPLTRETALFFALLAWYTLTTFSSPDLPEDAQAQYIRVMKLYIGIFPTFFLINTKEKFRWLFIIIALSFGLVGLKGGIFAITNGFKWRVMGPPHSFYADNNDIALALNMTLPLILCIANNEKDKRIKYFFYLSFLFTIFSIVSSWSRGGLITLCVVMGGILIGLKRKWIVLLIIVVAPIFLARSLPEGWVERMQTIQTFQEDLSVQGRFKAWRYAINRAEENPLTGGGFGTFELNKKSVDKYTAAHSAYFEILGEHGYIALFLWLSLLYGTIIALQRIRNTASDYPDTVWMRDYARAIQISLMAYAVGAANLGAAYWDYFYHLVGLCVLLKVMLLKTMEENEQKKMKLRFPKRAEI